MSTISRRQFLGDSTRALAGTAVMVSGVDAVSPVLGTQTQKPGPNDKIHVALIGSGGMGKNDLSAFLRIPEVDCLAVADVDEEHLLEGLRLVEETRGKRPQGYSDFREILDRQDIHAVIVGTPDHWHALAMILACQAGKDVYVEKPLATSIQEGRAMITAARKCGRIVQVGTQQRSAGHFQDAVAFVQSGQLGKIRMVRAWAYLDWKGDIGNPPDSAPPPGVDYDFWLGPAPLRPFNPMRFHHNFRWFWDYSGGLMADWGAHMIDVVMWAMKEEPVREVSVGGKYGFPDDIRETPDTQQAVVEFQHFSMEWEHMIGCGVGPWQREHGVEFHAENGVLVVDREGWEVHPETDQLKQPERVFRMMARPRQPAAGDFHFAHIQNFIACVKSRQTPAADVEVGHRSIIPCHLGNIAVRLRRNIRWDAAKEQIINDPEAQQFVGRNYRKPWVLPIT